MNNCQNNEQSEDLKRSWAAGCHASALLGLLIPFGNILGPFFVWLVNKDRYPEVMTEGKVAMNFQITATLIIFVMGSLISFFSFFLTESPVLTYLGVGVISYIPLILAAVKANCLFRRALFEYPIVFRFIK